MLFFPGRLVSGVLIPTLETEPGVNDKEGTEPGESCGGGVVGTLELCPQELDPVSFSRGPRGNGLG